MGDRYWKDLIAFYVLDGHNPDVKRAKEDRGGIIYIYRERYPAMAWHLDSLWGMPSGVVKNLPYMRAQAARTCNNAWDSWPQSHNQMHGHLDWQGADYQLRWRQHYAQAAAVHMQDSHRVAGGATDSQANADSVLLTPRSHCNSSADNKQDQNNEDVTAKPSVDSPSDAGGHKKKTLLKQRPVRAALLTRRALVSEMSQRPHLDP